MRKGSTSSDDVNGLSQEILSLKQATGYLKKQKSKKNAALTAAEQGKTYITEDDLTTQSNFQIVTWKELDPAEQKNKLSPERLNI